MDKWFLRYRELILFLWGICLLTFIIIFHVVADSLAYVVLAGAIGIPLVVGGLGAKKNGNGSQDDRNGS